MIKKMVVGKDDFGKICNALDKLFKGPFTVIRWNDYDQSDKDKIKILKEIKVNYKVRLPGISRLFNTKLRMSKKGKFQKLWGNNKDYGCEVCPNGFGDILAKTRGTAVYFFSRNSEIYFHPSGKIINVGFDVISEKRILTLYVPCELNNTEKKYIDSQNEFAKQYAKDYWKSVEEEFERDMDSDLY
jgi:hypothetical protein